LGLSPCLPSRIDRGLELGVVELLFCLAALPALLLDQAIQLATLLAERLERSPILRSVCVEVFVNTLFVFFLEADEQVPEIALPLYLGCDVRIGVELRLFVD